MRTFMSGKNPAFRLARGGIFLCLALIFSYLETLLPLFSGVVPGCKAGFANIVITFAACFFGLSDALCLSLLRVCLSSLLFGNLSGFFFSLGGALCAFACMALLLRNTKSVSVLGLSCAGAVCHNLGQLCVCGMLLGSGAVFSYAPLLVLAGIFTGTVNGILLAFLFPALRKSGIFPACDLPGSFCKM